MSCGPQYIEFDGLFSESLPGIYRIIRGFADLRDLAAASVIETQIEGEFECWEGETAVKLMNGQIWIQT